MDAILKGAMINKNTLFNGELNIGLKGSPELSLILCRAGKDFFKNMHKVKTNQLLWNEDNQELYYLNKNSVLFKIFFKEVTRKEK
jgi:hypothetical protein